MAVRAVQVAISAETETHEKLEKNHIHTNQIQASLPRFKYLDDMLTYLLLAPTGALYVLWLFQSLEIK